jgi:hypothetical protein
MLIKIGLSFTTMSEVRRSSRLKVKPPPQLVEEPNSDAEQDTFNPDEPDYRDSEDDHRSTKRRRTSTAKQRTSTNQRKAAARRVGKLAKLPDMPLDLLFEAGFWFVSRRCSSP